MLRGLHAGPLPHSAGAAPGCGHQHARLLPVSPALLMQKPCHSCVRHPGHCGILSSLPGPQPFDARGTHV